MNSTPRKFGGAQPNAGRPEIPEALRAVTSSFSMAPAPLADLLKRKGSMPMGKFLIQALGLKTDAQ